MKGTVQVNSVTVNSFQQRWQKEKSGKGFYASAFNESANAKNTQRRDEFVRQLDKDADTAFVYDKFGKVEKAYDARTELTLMKMHKQVEEAKTKGETTDVLIKCIRISNRIIRGDNVPAKDDNYLFKNYPRMHLQAWSLRREKDDPENCKSELKDEDEEHPGVDISFSLRGLGSGSNAGSDFNIAVEGLEFSAEA